jgi:hypothetical protein
MKSNFLDDVIDTDKVKLRVIGRSPDSSKNAESGLLTVQVQTFGNPGAMCIDYVIVLRGTGLSGLNEKGKVYAYAVTDTSYFNDCLSVSSIVVPKGYLNSWFDIEVYEKGLTKEEIELGLVEESFFNKLLSLDRTIKPVATLKEQLLWDLPIQEEEKGFTGTIASGVNSLSTISNPLNSINTFMKTAGLVALFGVGVYFLFPLFPDLRKKVSKKINK